MSEPTPIEAETRGGSCAPAACSAFLDWFNASPWGGAGRDAGELAEAAWNAGVMEASEIFWRHEITLKRIGIGDSQVLVAAIKGAAKTPNDQAQRPGPPDAGQT
jgi:hypothetical protein